jgi:hypothetical protein
MTRKSTTEKAQTSEDQILEMLLKDAPKTEEIELDLPSRGIGYKSIAGNAPTLRPMTFDDEKALMSKTSQADPMNALLARCLSNISVNELYQPDKVYILLKLREISYGDDYPVEITCPNCSKDSQVMFKLSSLNVNYVDEEFSDPVEIELPVLKHKVGIRLPRVKDEKYFETSDSAIANLWRFVEYINEYDQKTLITKFLQKLPLRDAHALLSALSGKQFGIDTQVNFLCQYCNTKTRMEMPITSDFFTTS